MEHPENCSCHCCESDRVAYTNKNERSDTTNTACSPEFFEAKIAKVRREISDLGEELYQLKEALKQVCPHKAGVEQFEGDGFCRRCGELID